VKDYTLLDKLSVLSEVCHGDRNSIVN